jgi:localization factor PodJL
MSAGEGNHGDVRGMADCAANDLKDLMSQVIHQLSESDRRNGEMLRQMQDRLSHLGQEARSVRPKVPSEYLPGFDRIEDGMTLLAQRIAETYAHKPAAPSAQVPAHALSAETMAPYAAVTPGVYVPPMSMETSPVAANAIAFPPAHATASEDVQFGQPQPLRSSITGQASPRPGKYAANVDNFDVVESLPGNPAEPWSPEQAAALTRLYTSREALFSDPAVLTEPAPAVALQDAPFPPHVHGSTTAAPEPVAIAADRDWLEARLADISDRIEQSLSGTRPEMVLGALERRLDDVEHRMTQVLKGVATKTDVRALHQIETQLTALNAEFEAVRGELMRMSGLDQQLAAIMDQVSDERLGALLDQAVRNSSAGAAPRQDTDLHGVAIAAAEAAASRVAMTGRDGRVDDVHRLLSQLVEERRQGDEHTAHMLDTLQQAMLRMLDRVEAIEGGAMQSFAVTHEQYAPPGDVRPAAMMSRETTREAPYHAQPAAEDTEPVDPIAAQRSQMQASVQRAAMAQREKLKAQATASSPAGVQRAAAAKASAKGGSSRLMVSGLAAAFVLSAILGTLVLSMQRSPSSAVLASPVKATTDGAKAPAHAAREAAPPAAQAQRTAPPERTVARRDTPPEPVSQPQRMPMPETVTDDLGQASDVREFDRVPDVGTLRGNVAKSQYTPPSPLSGMVLQNVPDTEQATAGKASRIAPGTTVVPISANAADISADANQSQGAGQGRALELPAATVGPHSLRLAAAQGDMSAEFEVASRLAEGKGTDQNLKEAVRWYQRAATQGLAQAQYRLGTFYERGLGLKADLSRAKSWYQRAADGGNVKAMHNLAVLAAGRAAESPDYGTAVQWFTQAASFGLPDSQFNLGVLLESGLGSQKDMVQAAMWYTLAARSGDKEAIRRRDAMKSKMDATDLAAAEHLAKTWTAQPQDKLANDAKYAGEMWKSRQAAAPAE